MFITISILLFLSVCLNVYFLIVRLDDNKHLRMAADVIHCYKEDVKELESLYAQRKAFNMTLLTHISQEHTAFPSLEIVHLN